jgi:hypothetical protein
MRTCRTDKIVELKGGVRFNETLYFKIQAELKRRELIELEKQMYDSDYISIINFPKRTMRQKHRRRVDNVKSRSYARLD